MSNYIKINHKDKTIVMGKEFYRNSLNPLSQEYQTLQAVRKDYPTYKPIERKIKKNINKKTYSGLTYAYMEDYIITHEPQETVAATLEEFNDMILVSKCHSQAFRYPTIKKWFLNRYPEILNFGTTSSTAILSAAAVNSSAA